MIFFTRVIVKYMKNNLVIANKFYQSFGPSLYGDPTVTVFRFNSGGRELTLPERERIIICHNLPTFRRLLFPKVVARRKGPLCMHMQLRKYKTSARRLVNWSKSLKL